MRQKGVILNGTERFEQGEDISIYYMAVLKMMTVMMVIMTVMMVIMTVMMVIMTVMMVIKTVMMVMTTALMRLTVILTETLREPLRLVVVLHRHCAGVQEDEDDDKPEPPLLFAHPPHPELELLQGEHQAWTRRFWKEMNAFKKNGYKLVNKSDDIRRSSTLYEKKKE